MKRVLAILLVLVMLLGMTACGTTKEEPKTPEPQNEQPQQSEQPQQQSEPETPKRENEERYGGDIIVVTGEVTSSMDPHFSGNSMVNFDWMRNVMEGPLVTGSDGQVYPLVCSYDYAADGLSLKLTVNDYKFSNGEKVTIEDVYYSFERSKNRPSFVTKFWNFVEDWKLEGDTIVFTFNTINPIILTELGDINCGVYIMPAKICKEYMDKEITDESLVIGTGPYVLQKWDPDRDTILVRNENYSSPDPGGPGAAERKHAYADRIIYSTNVDAASRTAGMIAHEYTVGSITTEMQPYAEKIGLKRYLANNQWTHYIYFNTRKENAKSPINDVNLRKAIRAALDIEAIMYAISEGDTERNLLDPCLVPEENIAYYNTIVKDQAYNLKDMELAKKYLAESSYKGEEITYLVIGGGAYYRAAMVIVPVLEELGINIKLWVCDNSSYSGFATESVSDYDISFWETQKALINPSQKNIPFQSGSREKRYWWYDDEQEECIQTVMTSPNGSPESVAAFKRFNELIVEDCPYICFGTKLSVLYHADNFVIDYKGITAYYWNSYFE